MNHPFLFKLILFLCFVGMEWQVYAQKCKTTEIKQRNIARNPAIQDKIDALNEFTEKWIRENPQAAYSKEVITLPVVVHVIWRTEEENISEAQVISQIETLNQDFRKLNENFSNTPAPFVALAADVELEFCLASIDPDGNPTNGITRTQTDFDNIGDSEDWYADQFGGKDAWDNSQYINIWICDLGEDGNLGFASLPETADPPESDGIVIDFKFFGTTGTAASSIPNHLGRTTTHEVGHYLNLDHLWGPENGGCNEDDFVDDTPLQFTESEECPTFPFTDQCTSDGNGIMFNNFMDYADDECMTMFTMGQKMRMLAALNGPRSSLLTSNVCGVMTSIGGMSERDVAFKVYPNPVQSLLYLQSTVGKKIHVQLFDIQGNIFQKLDVLEGEITIDTSNFPQGIYYLRCEEQPNSLQKIVVF